MKQNKQSFLLGVASFLLFAQSAFANPTHDDLKRIENELQQERKVQIETRRKADILADEIRSVQRQMVRSAQAVQEKEDLLLRLEEKLEFLREDEQRLMEKLSASKARTVHLVTALQSLALKPKEQIFLDKQAPSQILRSRLMLNSSVPIARQMTQEALADMARLEETKLEIQAQIRRVKDTMSKLTERTEQMNTLIAKKTKLQAEYDATHQKARKRILSLAAQANDLKELLQKLEIEKQRRLEEERKKKEEEAKRKEVEEIQPRINMLAPTEGSFEKAKGSLSYPVVGQIVENYGDVTMKGVHSKGMTIKTRQGTTLRAPFKGTVLFSGPFKSYGNMLIIDCGEGYFVLLAGLEEINAWTGQEIIAGEPIGKMGSDRLKLYLEIRKDGQAIDPKPWFQN